MNAFRRAKQKPTFGRASAIYMVISLWITCLGLSAAEWNQSFIAKRRTTENGLPQNSVYAVHQSRDGYLWIGTAQGPARFDGVTFQSFDGDLIRLGVSELTVRSIFEDGEGTLWINFPSHLVCYKHGEFIAWPANGETFGMEIWGMAPDPTSGVWLGGVNGILLFRDGKVVSRISSEEVLNSWAVTRLVSNREHGLFMFFSLLGANSVPQYFDFQSRTSTSLDWWREYITLPIVDLSIDQAGSVWIVTVHGLYRWGKELSRDIPPVLIKTINELQRCYTDRSGRACLMRKDRKGLAILDRDGEIEIPDGAFPGLEDIRCVEEDREGSIWIGTGKNGLVQLLPRRINLYSDRDGLSGGETWSLSPRKKGGLWIGTSGGLALLSDEKFSGLTFPNHASQHRADCVFEDRDGMVWVDFLESGFYRFDHGMLIRVKGLPAGVSEGTVRAISQDHQGTLWLSTSEGLWRYDRTNQIEKVRVPEMVGVLGTIEDQQDRVWAGTERSGLFGTKERATIHYGKKDGLLSDTVWPLHLEEDGTLWVGTPAGLNRIRAGEITSVTSSNGLFSDLIYYLLPGPGNNYWMSCNRGIFRVSHEELHAVADGKIKTLQSARYGEADGMDVTEGNGEFSPGACRSVDGSLWFPNISGLVRIPLPRLLESEVAPLVILDQVHIDGEAIVSGNILKKHLLFAAGSRNVIRLSSGRARQLDFHFSAASFIAPEKVRFRYILQGHDKDWRDTDIWMRTAFYTNLRPGQYTFQVKASNSHGIFGDAIASFSFNLAPRFYQRGSFYVLSGTCLLALAYGLLQHRLRVQSRIMALEQQHALEQERSRIARDMHDDLGAELTHIKLLGEIASRELDRPEDARAHLRKLQMTANRVTQNLDEMVWTINPSRNSLEDLAAYLGHYAEELFQGKETRCRLDLQTNLPPLPLADEVRHNLFSAIKEVLSNVLQHARASEVWLRLRFHSGMLTIVVEDNGKGMDPGSRPGKPRGDGLSNVQVRVGQLGGSVAWDSKNGNGTKVTIRAPVAGVCPKENK